MEHARDHAQSWGWKVKSVGACMVVCVCICVLEIFEHHSNLLKKF